MQAVIDSSELGESSTASAPDRLAKLLEGRQIANRRREGHCRLVAAIFEPILDQIINSYIGLGCGSLLDRRRVVASQVRPPWHRKVWVLEPENRDACQGHARQGEDYSTYGSHRPLLK